MVTEDLKKFPEKLNNSFSDKIIDEKNLLCSVQPILMPEKADLLSHEFKMTCNNNKISTVNLDIINKISKNHLQPN